MVRVTKCLALALALLLLFVTPALAQVPPGYEDQIQTYSERGFLLTDDLWLAQTFTAGECGEPDTRQLVNVELMLGGIDGKVNVQIRDGSPTGKVLGETTIKLKGLSFNKKSKEGIQLGKAISSLNAMKNDYKMENRGIKANKPRNGSDSLKSMSVSTQEFKTKCFDFFNYYTVSFSDVKVTSGNQYAIVVSAPNNICIMTGTNSRDYSGGDAYFSTNSGDAWNLLNNFTDPFKINDFYFKTYVACIESYEDEHLNPVCNLFTADKNTIYIGGYGLEKNTGYSVAYYDAEGRKIVSYHNDSDKNGVLSSSYQCNSIQDAKDGTWHAVVYKQVEGEPAESYNSNDPNIVMQDEFEVDAGAIPEFPAVVSSIMVVGICAGIYSRIKKRKLSMAG